MTARKKPIEPWMCVPKAYIGKPPKVNLRIVRACLRCEKSFKAATRFIRLCPDCRINPDLFNK